MNKHRITQHSRRLDGTEVTPEEVERVWNHGKHKPRVVICGPAPIPVDVPADGDGPATTVGSTGVDGSAADELAMAVASFLPPPVDEISEVDRPDLPDSPVRMSEKRGKKEKPAKVVTRIKPAKPAAGLDPPVRKQTRPALWCQAARSATAEYHCISAPKTGGDKTPAHKRKPLTPHKLAKMISHRPDMTDAALTECIGTRYGMTPEGMRQLHNQVLIVRAMCRRQCRKFQGMIPWERTPEATTSFYVAINEAVKEAGSSGSETDFI